MKSESLFRCPIPTDRQRREGAKQRERERERRTISDMEDPTNGKSNQRPQCPPLANPTLAPTTSPFRGPYHRRAHSEVQFRLPEDLDLSEPFGGFDELGSEDDLFCSYMDIEKLGSGSGSASDSAGPSAPRSDNPFSAENGGGGRDEAGNSRPRHRHSLSVDGSSTLESIEAKKAMAPDKLAELWVVDPKRAKRFHLSHNPKKVGEFLVFVSCNCLIEHDLD